MLAGSKLLAVSVEVESSHQVVNDAGPTSNSHSLGHHNLLLHHHHRLPKTRHSRRVPPKSPDLIELSDAGPSPVSGLEDDSSPGVTDADSEDPHSVCDTESPTPTNSEANVNPKNYWHAGEEHRELLATEGEDEEDDDDDEQRQDDRRKSIEELVEIYSSDSDVGTSANQSSDSDVGNNSYSNDVEEIDEEELWKISSEQLAYYKGQFKGLQPDPSGLVGGAQAKQFFEKSRLPNEELSRIWQLSDVTKDGALSLSEFCTAMHLVVLRRNNIALPKQLPPVLDPLHSPLLVAAPPENGATVAKPSATATSASAIVATSATEAPAAAATASAAVVAAAAPAAAGGGVVAAAATSSESAAGTSQHWTKFVDSPTGSLASPGPRPVNFDFKRAQVEQDPRILHPVALRLTPESQSVDHSVPSGAVSLPVAVSGSTLMAAAAAASTGSSHSSSSAASSSSSSNNTASASAVTNSSNSTGTPLGGKKEPPPPPPPRPYRGHARSSSLDLNQLGGRSSALYPAAPPPAVPPRVSPSMGSPRKENEVSQASSGAFQVYRRPVAAAGGAASGAPPERKPTVRGLTSVIEDHQRRGEVLRKQQHMLAKQLADIQEERVSLELRLQRIHLSECQ